MKKFIKQNWDVAMWIVTGFIIIFSGIRGKDFWLWLGTIGAVTFGISQSCLIAYYRKAAEHWKQVTEGLRGKPRDAYGLYRKNSLEDATRALVSKLDVVIPTLDNWAFMEANRGRPYDGPNFGEELKRVRAILDPEGGRE